MKYAKHWLISLDLSNMDDILIGYSAFLTSVIKPDTITFFHTIESGPTALEIVEQFPEISSKEEFDHLIRNELKDKIAGYFDDESIEIRVVLKEGKPTDQIIEIVQSLEPDLLLMGKKIGYLGEGVIPKRILKYVPCSVLFVPENSRYSLENILVPVDFSEQTANAIITADELLNGTEGTITAQHIYHYKAQFFPYILSPEEKKEIDDKIREKLQKFKNQYDLPSNVNYVLSQHKQGNIADVVYHQAMSDQADLIIVASKSEKLTSFVRHDFTDKMLDYAFGIPLLIQKNKEKHQKFLQSLFS